MRARPLAALLAPVALSAVMAGCIQGAFFPAAIPQEAWAPGWSLDQDNTQSGERGLEPIVKARYQANVYEHLDAPQGLVAVISVSDVPLLDEQAEIQKQLAPIIAEYQVSLTERRRATGNIGSDAVSFTVSDATRTVQGVNLRGFAVDVPYTCGANGMAVRVFGFAVTEVQAPIIGTQTRLDTWRELAGEAESGALGGMVARVRCS